MVLGVVLMVGAALQERGSLNPAAVLLMAAMLMAAALTLYALWFVLATTSIWFVKTWNATEVLRAVLTAGRYPVAAFPPALRTLFTLVLPVAFLTTVPAEALLERATAPWIGGSVAVACGALAISRAFWQLALRFYTSASS